MIILADSIRCPYG